MVEVVIDQETDLGLDQEVHQYAKVEADQEVDLILDKNKDIAIENHIPGHRHLIDKKIEDQEGVVDLGKNLFLVVNLNHQEIIKSLGAQGSE